ncbi:unnamed protein product, partial [Phaeothamnion confervicola]
FLYLLLSVGARAAQLHYPLSTRRCRGRHIYRCARAASADDNRREGVVGSQLGEESQEGIARKNERRQQLHGPQSAGNRMAGIPRLRPPFGERGSALTRCQAAPDVKIRSRRRSGAALEGEG